MKNTFFKLIACVLTVLTLVSVCESSLAVFASEIRENAAEARVNSYADVTNSDLFVEPYIVSENEAGRREYEKQFLLSDGSYLTAVYNEPVHFLVDGKWTEIDNSLEKTSDGYTEKSAGRMSVAFDASDLDRLFSVSMDGYSVELLFAENDNDDASGNAAGEIVVTNREDPRDDFDVKDARTLVKDAKSKNGSVSEEELKTLAEEQSEIIVLQREEKTELEKISSSIEFKDALPGTDIE